MARTPQPISARKATRGPQIPPVTISRTTRSPAGSSRARSIRRRPGRVREAGPAAELFGRPLVAKTGHLADGQYSQGRHGQVPDAAGTAADPRYGEADPQAGALAGPAAQARAAQAGAGRQARVDGALGDRPPGGRQPVRGGLDDAGPGRGPAAEAAEGADRLQYRPRRRGQRPAGAAGDEGREQGHRAERLRGGGGLGEPDGRDEPEAEADPHQRGRCERPLRRPPGHIPRDRIREELRDEAVFVPVGIAVRPGLDEPNGDTAPHQLPHQGADVIRRLRPGREVLRRLGQRPQVGRADEDGPAIAAGLGVARRALGIQQPGQRLPGHGEIAAADQHRLAGGPGRRRDAQQDAVGPALSVASTRCTPRDVSWPRSPAAARPRGPAQRSSAVLSTAAAPSLPPGGRPQCAPGPELQRYCSGQKLGQEPRQEPRQDAGSQRSPKGTELTRSNLGWTHVVAGVSRYRHTRPDGPVCPGPRGGIQ